ncbi:DNA primase [Candidatus Pacearchaeota archaeon]|nr:DNA primase [Candidatus Pacearchaeota archaeon]
MAKISPASIKYVIHAKIELSAVAEKPDVIGAVFGQTEGLLGEGLELRELQKSGKIGRIDVNLKVKDGKSEGEIVIPSSMDKAETAIIAAAVETIERVGPCEAKITSSTIDDVRETKRKQVMDRAKELLKSFVQKTTDSQEFTKEVVESVRTEEITEYGPDRLPCGPDIEDQEELIIVEGRADVLNLLKYGINNVVGLNGATVPPSIKELAKSKKVTLFLDGDRGGKLIQKKVETLLKPDKALFAPDGKEVEELTGKEILKALRTKDLDTIKEEEEPKEEKEGENNSEQEQKPIYQRENRSFEHRDRDYKSSNRFDRNRGRQDRFSDRRPARFEGRFESRFDQRARPFRSSTEALTQDIKQNLKDYAKEIKGTKHAFILDEQLNVLGKIPSTELEDTIRSMHDGIFAVIQDAKASKDLIMTCEYQHVKFLVAKEFDGYGRNTKLLTPKDLE